MDSSARVEQTERSLTLTAVESSLKTFLLDVAAYINPANPSELRFTGGWVRDKLLGVGSHDIDVAINDMTGYQFGLKMKEYLEQPGNPEKYGLTNIAEADDTTKKVDQSDIVHGLHKIEANPEKSKHLETVTTKIFGLDIDLVNLRKETYTEDSRNPQMEFGTPEEDALRRDATVNAMFYNLQTERVEDLTGRGLVDMHNKIIRTPLEPLQTFTDDPLRVLRLIRFASRLNYAIDTDCKQAMKAKAIKESLKIKISRERVGVELEKMLKGPDPHMALSLIDEMGLYSTIFTDPTAAACFAPDSANWSSSYDFARNFINAVGHESRDTLILDKNDEYVTWLLSSFTPFADAPTPEQVKGKIPPPLAAAVARQGIKATNKICDVISASVSNFEDIITTKDRFSRRNKLSGGDPDPASRDTLGMAIRKWGPTWRNQAVYALIVDKTRTTRDVMSEWDSFIKHLRTLDILEAYDFKPIIDGTILAKSLNTRPGPWMKDALNVVIAWQLRHPENATQAGAIEAVKAHQEKEKQDLSNSQGELTADLVHHFLTLTIRPLFAQTAQTHSDTITPQGRKIDRVLKGGPKPRRYEGIEDESVTRPWKAATGSHAIELLQWVARSLTPTITERNWPLLIPPILTLLDDTDTKFKAIGCNLLRDLLEATPRALIKRTGLADVFDEALQPSLSYLPTLTPESESVHILNAAYPALLTLTRVRHSLPPPQQPTYKQKHKTVVAPPPAFSPYSLALIKILHSHIFPSLTHTSPPTAYPKLTNALLTHLHAVIETLRIDAVAQLIHVVPLLNSILRAPFATTTAENLRMLHTAVGVMQVLVANTWPRMVIWRAQVLEGAVGAWVSLAEEENEKTWSDDDEAVLLVEDVRSALRVFVEMVLRAVDAVVSSTRSSGEDGTEDGEIVDFRNELRELVDANTTLEGLFGSLVASRAEVPPL